MPDDPLITQIAALLLETGRTHHQTFLETDGDDPEWPLWYAQNLQGELGRLLNKDLTLSEITYHLIRLDKAYAAKARRQSWHEFYARELIAEYSMI